jgi:hypothetical protein
MTMFVHHAIVHCGEDRCWHGEANGVQSAHCQYTRFTGEQGKMVVCSLFMVELELVPGKGTPARCDECLAAEGMFRVEGRPKSPPPTDHCSRCLWWQTRHCPDARPAPGSQNACAKFREKP